MGRPDKPADLADYDFIGFESATKLIDMFNGMGIPVTRDNFGVYSASGIVTLKPMERGLGISVMTDDVAGAWPGLEKVLPSMPPIPIPAWLITHRELHTCRRIRLVSDTIAECVGELAVG